MPYFCQGKKSSIVFMLPGQGCQFYQMGRELYQNHSVFHRWMNELDALVRGELGQSVIAEIYSDNHARSKAFDDIRLSHPAIFMVEYALGKTLIEQHIAPDYLLGASLGETAAAALADVLPLSDAVRFVVRQGLLFHRRQSEAVDGAMLAVLANASLYEQTPLLSDHCEIAAYHAPALFVIAGASARIAEVERYLGSRDILFQRLPVRQAFHSRHIDFLEPDIKALTRQLSPRPAKTAIISCRDTGPLNRLAADHFWQVIREPIRFAQTLARLERDAAERGESLIYLDLGPSGTFANLVRQNHLGGPLPQIFPVLSAFGHDLEKFDAVRLLGRTLQPMAAQTVEQGQARAHAAPRPIQPPAPLQEPHEPQASPHASSSATRLQQNTQPPHAPLAPPATEPKVVYVFPGQGSQRVGMGAELFEQFPDHVAKADDILGYSLKTLCLEDPDQRLSNTQYTQPALYAVGALTFLSRQRQDARQPDFLAGHSLGEYCALFAAGAFSFETGLKLVKKRGELMARATGGSMAAVIGRSPDDIASLLSKHRLDALDIANYNSQAQIVLSGPIEALSDAKEIFQKLDIPFIPLSVSAPFHSRYMQRSMEVFGEYLRQFSYAPLRTPVISNVDATPYRDNALIDTLTRQICGSVRWLDTIRYLMRTGEFVFEELGPGNVLSKLINSIRAA
jgi:malonyl CoA-acyl carrier protein transacylase